jgi:hypothetical protein
LNSIDRKLAEKSREFVRVDEGHAPAESVGASGQGGHLGDQAHDLLAPHLGVEDVLGLGIEGGQRRNGGHQDAHRVGVVMEAFEELLAHVLMDERVMGDLVAPGFELFGGGQLAVDQQVRHLEVRRTFGQLLDRVAPVAQNAVDAVQFGDGRIGGGGGAERRIVKPDAGHQLVPGFGVHPALIDGNLDGFAAAVVGDGDGFGHMLMVARRADAHCPPWG